MPRPHQLRCVSTCFPMTSDRVIGVVDYRRMGSSMATESTVLWVTRDGVRCVLRAYDETRYQLRLLRENGTIKTDLVRGYAQAVLESDAWRRQLESHEAANNKMRG